MGLACEQKLPEYADWQGFRRVYKKNLNITNRYAKSLFKEYKSDPDKFFGRKRVQDILKARGDIPYTPSENLEKAYREVNTAILLSHGDSDTAKIAQFVTNLAAAQKAGMPEIYDTLPGKIGTIAGTIINKLLPF